MKNNVTIFAGGIMIGIFILQMAVGFFTNYPSINIAFYGILIIVGIWLLVNFLYHPKRYFIISYRGEWLEGHFYSNLYVDTESYPNYEFLLNWVKKEVQKDVKIIIPFSINEVSKSDFLLYQQNHEKQSI